MKKLLVAVAVLCTAGALAGSVAANPDAGKVLDSGFECYVIDGNGNLFATQNSTLTLYQAKLVLRCVDDGAPAEKLTYWNYTNWPPPDGGGTCGVGSDDYEPVATTDWQDKVGRNGNTQVTCVLHGEFSAAAPSGNGVAGVR